MPRSRTILALGSFHPERRKRFETFARETSFELVVHEQVADAIEWLGSNDPRVVLFDTAAAKPHSLCLRVRSNKKLSAVPIIGLTRVISDSAMSKLFAAGCDDVVPIAARDPLLHRLQAIPPDRSIPPPPDRGRALVADSNHDRCSVMGRTLMNAGYEVRFAIDRRALEHYARDRDVKLVVASAELGPAEELITAARKAGSTEAVWVITDVERDVAAGVEPIANVDRAVTVSAFVPPESLLFLSNELSSPQLTSKRLDPRVLHGTVVAFREAGTDEDEIGFSYNVSTHGVFIRTLAPPACKMAWIELTPPGEKRRVRLQGEIAWRRPFDPTRFAITPPGFGVHLSAGLGADLQCWTSGVERLVSGAKKRQRLDELLEETLRDSMVEPIEAPPVRKAPDAAASPLPAVPRPRSAPPPLPDVVAREPADGATAPPVSKDPPPLPSAGEQQPAPRPRSEPPALPTPASQLAPQVVSPERIEPSTAPVVPTQPKRLPRSLSLIGAGALVIGGALAAMIALTWPGSGQAPQPGPAATRGSSESQSDLAPAPLPVSGSLPASTSPATSVSAAASPPLPASLPAPPSQASPPQADSTEVPVVASSAPAEEPDPGPDGTDLLTIEGYLVVRSSVTADVYATGVKLGATNARNKARCGQKYVRLGQGEPPRWISEGATVKITCQSVTRVTLQPKR